MGRQVSEKRDAASTTPARPNSVLPDGDIVLAHDYATQCGGAERVALKIAESFPGSPIFTTIYEPGRTFPEFGLLDVHTGPLNRCSVFRQHHRLALPLLAPSVYAQRLSAKLLVASSTGWAHGYQGTDHTIVYCHSPARWLYQSARYLGTHRNPGLRGLARQYAATAALRGLTTPLRGWDQRQARRADLYLVNSTVTKNAVEDVYGIEAEVLSPPPALAPGDPERPVVGIEPGYLLCVARMLPYKNIDAVIEAVNSLVDTRLVVVGEGPDWHRLAALAGPRVQLLGPVDDAQLRWLYRHAAALVAASYEDYGLSPLEAGGFGRPSVVLGEGGFLDTVVEGETGVVFDAPTPGPIAEGIREVLRRSWDEETIAAHVAQFSSERFIRRLRAIAGRFVGATPYIPAQPGPAESTGTPDLVA